MRRHWELRELSGVRLALTLGDKGELDEALAKLRAGPLFHPPDWRWLGD